MQTLDGNILQEAGVEGLDVRSPSGGAWHTASFGLPEIDAKLLGAYLFPLLGQHLSRASREWIPNYTISRRKLPATLPEEVRVGGASAA